MRCVTGSPTTLLPALLASDRAPEPRTLVDILAATTEAHPTRSRSTAASTCSPTPSSRRPPASWRARLRGGRRPARRPGRGPGQVRAPPTSTSPSSRILLAGAAYVPVDADDPDERARVVFDEAGAAAVVGNDLAVASRAYARPRTAGRRPRGHPPPDGRRLGHLHLRLDRHPQGRRRHAPQRRGLRRRRVPVVPPGRAHRPRRPGDGRPVGRLRRELRGDVAGLGVRRLPGPRAALAGALRRRRRALAGRQRHHRRLDGADPGRAVAGERRWRRSGC